MQTTSLLTASLLYYLAKLKMFSAQYGNRRATAFKDAFNYFKECPLRLKKIHHHRNDEERAQYATEVTRFEDIFPDGLPKSFEDRQLGQDYFVTYVLLHINGPNPYKYPPPLEIKLLEDELHDHIAEQNPEGLG